MNHLGGAYECGDANTIMEDVWGYLIVKYDLKTMIDIGCGFGHAMKWFSKFQVGVHGIDGWPDAVGRNLCPNHAFIHDFSTGTYPKQITADLAWSAEFLEHLEERFLPNVMPMFAACRYAAITHAEPGQPGQHHVNCQKDDYWIGMFASYGMFLDFDETNILRKTDRCKAGWGRRTLMLFERKNDVKKHLSRFESETRNIDWCQNPIEREI